MGLLVALFFFLLFNVKNGLITLCFFYGFQGYTLTFFYGKVRKQEVVLLIILSEKNLIKKPMEYMH